MPYVGTVVNGIVNSGRVKTGDAVVFGPDANGNYQTTVVKSMQRKRFVQPGLLKEFGTMSPDTNRCIQSGCYNG